MVDSAGSAVVVITDVGCDVGLFDIDSIEVAVLVMVDGSVDFEPAVVDMVGVCRTGDC